MLAAIAGRLERLIVTRADHPRALEPGKIVEVAQNVSAQTNAGIQVEVVVPVSAALSRALELSAKDGSIIVSAGSMFVTAEVKTAWESEKK
jgi:folylpolyglutamate synthase/dihydropteroate synthase